VIDGGFLGQGAIMFIFTKKKITIQRRKKSKKKKAKRPESKTKKTKNDGVLILPWSLNASPLLRSYDGVCIYAL
jgi:hypothetical protein